ncbi:hypothetical protein CEP54_015796 [Fusarium duplospermum]|uniref:Uncharacterized protein n=1 Tax=Fusarium duplospermum TaxID=1325734 RepID=A0A428NL55_9HYPO|nr:hypothetical protein CEP54_015796 [Fusarium duplospermum]
MTDDCLGGPDIRHAHLDITTLVTPTCPKLQLCLCSAWITLPASFPDVTLHLITSHPPDQTEYQECPSGRRSQPATRDPKPSIALTHEASIRLAGNDRGYFVLGKQSGNGLPPGGPISVPEGNEYTSLHPAPDAVANGIHGE